MASKRANHRAFFGVSALLFAASTAVTIAWCASMSAMGGMPMRGGWTMSMAWMRMPKQTWACAGASFIGMWTVMMVAMMLPSLVPMWTVFGLAAFPVGVALAEIEMRQPAVARAVPIAVGVVVLAAGALQFTAWKARYLACCREASGAESSLKRPPAAAAGPGRGGALPADAGTAWRHGLRLGLHCSCCCAGLMALLLVVGVMDLRAMAVVAAAITSERLAPAGARVARAIGAVVVGAGLFLIGRAAGSDKKRARRRARSRKRTWIVPAKQPHEVPPPSRYGFVVVLLTASSRTLSA